MPDVSAVKRKPGARLNNYDRVEILTLHRKHPDWTWVQLAEVCRCDERTARLTCLAAEHTTQDLMSAYALPMLNDWRKASHKASDRGDHRPARDWLLHAGVLEPLPDTSKSSGTQIVIVNNPLPGMPAPLDTGTSTVLELTPSGPVPGPPPVEPID